MTSALIVQEDGSHTDESSQQRLPEDALQLTHDLTLRDGSVRPCPGDPCRRHRTFAVVPCPSIDGVHHLPLLPHPAKHFR